jgi:hypothetical protein
MKGLRALAAPLALLLLIPVRAESLDPPCGVTAPPPTTSVTYYVSTGGDDANDGLTESTPWRTLDYAEDNATVPGARIALNRGDVFERATALGIHHGGMPGQPIVWDGDFWGTGDKATIRSSEDRDAPQKAIVNIIGASHVVFQNIVVDGNGTDAFGIVVGGTDSYYSPGGYQSFETDIVVQGNSILNCGNEHYDPKDENFDPDYYVIAFAHPDLEHGHVEHHRPRQHGRHRLQPRHRRLRGARRTRRDSVDAVQHADGPQHRLQLRYQDCGRPSLWNGAHAERGRRRH